MYANIIWVLSTLLWVYIITVILQDYDHIKEALKQKDWIDRIPYFFDFFAQRSFGKTLGKI